MGSKATPQQSTSSNAPSPAFMQEYYNLTSNAANTAGQNPWQPYTGEFTAPWNATQQSALDQISQAVQSAQPWLQTASNDYSGGTGLINQGAGYFAPASGLINQGAGAVGQGLGTIGQGVGIAQGALPVYGQAQQYASQGTTPLYNEVGNFMSPYINDVVNATQANFNHQNAVQSNSLLGQAIQAGNAFGGDREGIAQGELAYNQQLAQSPVIAGLYNQGYQSAMQSAQQQNQDALAAAGITNQTGAGVTGVGSTVGQLGAGQVGAGATLGGLGSQMGSLGLGLGSLGGQMAGVGTQAGSLGLGAGNLGLSGAGMTMGAGNTQQQIQQAQDTALYNQFLQQQAFPYQQQSWLTNLIGGLGSQSGGQSTSQTTPGSNMASNLFGMGTAASGLNGLLGSSGALGGMGAGLGSMLGYNAAAAALPASLQGMAALAPVMLVKDGGAVEGYDGGGLVPSALDALPGSSSPWHLTPWQHRGIGIPDAKAPELKQQSAGDMGKALSMLGSLSGKGTKSVTGTGASGVSMPDVSVSVAPDVGPFMSEMGDASLLGGMQPADLASGGLVLPHRKGQPIRLPDNPPGTPPTIGTSGTHMPDDPSLEQRGTPTYAGIRGARGGVMGYDDGGDVSDNTEYLALVNALGGEAAANKGIAAMEPLAWGGVAGYDDGGDVGDDDRGEPVPMRVASLDPVSRDYAIRTVYGEAGDEPPEGQAAVAHVIKNRRDAGRFGDTVKDVVTAPSQFEPWNNDAARKRMTSLDPNDPAYQKVAKVVDQTFAEENDPTQGATHFYSPGAQAALGRRPPEWARGQDGTKIGSQLFYRLPEGPAGPTRGNVLMHPEAGLAPPQQLAQAAPQQGGLSQEASLGLLAAGLGMMGGQSPNAFANISQGALQGINVYSGAKKLSEEAKRTQLALDREEKQDALAQQGMDIRQQQLQETVKARQDALAERTQSHQDTLAERQFEHSKPQAVGYTTDELGRKIPVLGVPGPNNTWVDPITKKPVVSADANTGQPTTNSSASTPALDSGNAYDASQAVSSAVTGQMQKTGGLLPPNTLKAMARYIVKTGDEDSQFRGLGTGAIGSTNRSRLKQAMYDQMNEDKMTPEEYGTRKTEWGARGAAQKKIAMQEGGILTASMELGNSIPLARQAIEAVPRTSSLQLNKLIEGVQNATLSPEQSNLYVKLQTVANAYAAVIARGSNVNSVFAQQHAHELLNSAADSKSLNAALDGMEQEKEQALKAPEQVREFYRKKYGPQSIEGGGATPSAPPATQPAGQQGQPGQPGTSAAAPASSLAQPKSKAEYDALKSGTHYLKDGVERVKP